MAILEFDNCKKLKQDTEQTSYFIIPWHSLSSCCDEAPSCTGYVGHMDLLWYEIQSPPSIDLV
jgi:hypothetical protein